MAVVIMFLVKDSYTYIYFADPFVAKNFHCSGHLLKVTEVLQLMNITAASMVIHHYRDEKAFCTHGLPEQIFTDNVPQFSFSEFGSFFKATVYLLD